MVKILEFHHQKSLLEHSDNPFALIILAQLAAIESNKRPHEQRLLSKITLTKLMYQKGWSKEYIDQLFRLIDWLIQLPPELVLKHEEAIPQRGEEKQMAYITSIERLAMKRGKEQGLQLGIEEGKKKVKKKPNFILLNNCG